MIEIRDILSDWLTEQGFVHGNAVYESFGIETAEGLRLFAFLRFNSTDKNGLIIGEVIDLNEGSVRYGHTWGKYKVFDNFSKPGIFDEIKDQINKAIEHLWLIYGKPNYAFVSNSAESSIH